MTTIPTTTTSTGPRTDSGKARSAQNSLKHGLSGAGKFLPDQLAAEVESRKVEFTDRFHPRDSFATFLVGQLALASVRIEHCQRLELEMTNHYLQHSASDQQAAHDDLLAAYLLHARIHRDPPTIRLQLLQTPAGRDILLRKLSNLLFGLTSGQCVWTSDDVTRLLDLLGFSREERHLDQEAVALKTLADVARNPSAPLDDRKTAGTALFERLQFEITKRRQESPDRALETSKNALRADGRWFHNHDDLKRLRRYEAAANRLFFKTLALLEAEQPDSPQPQPVNHEPATQPPPPPIPFQTNGHDRRPLTPPHERKKSGTGNRLPQPNTGSGQATGTGSGSFGPEPVPVAVRCTRSGESQTNSPPPLHKPVSSIADRRHLRGQALLEAAYPAPADRLAPRPPLRTSLVQALAPRRSY